MSLEEMDQKLNNPLTSLWSLTLQENYSILEGGSIIDKKDPSGYGVSWE